MALPDIFLDVFLLGQGITKNDVEMVDLKPAEMADALANGDVDAVSSWYPFLIDVEKKLGDRSVTFFDENLYTQSFNIVATQEFIRNNPDKVAKMLPALVKADDFVRLNPAEAQKIVADFCRMDMDALRQIWPLNSFRVALDPVTLAYIGRSVTMGNQQRLN